MLGNLIGAAGNLIGGLLGNKAEKKERQMQMAFAQNGIQWKVADAEKAGVHPLFALGAPTATYSPISTGSMSNAVSDMGQNLGRAVEAVRSPGQKIDAYTAKLQALQLERGSLENTLLRNQILNAQNQPGNPPTPAGGSLIAGQGGGRDLRVAGQRISPRLDENPAEDWEKEYGEISDLIGGARLARDSEPIIREWFRTQVEAAKRGEPGILTKDFDDIRRILGYLRGKRDREPTRSSGW